MDERAETVIAQLAKRSLAIDKIDMKIKEKSPFLNYIE